ncbi:MAG: phosphoribosylformylglycinamidine cyclo-ligase [Candidatus Omnitrophica bacterium]|nr:phosphoribosylformylglycinamidine cyclo-ligase [Candidatus Omnitrophota bacterium]
MKKPNHRPLVSGYAQAGVSLARAGHFLKAIKPLVSLTRRPGQLGSIGGFGGIFDLRQAGPRKGSLLVSSTDGVGTKLVLARRLKKYEGLGVDLVAMNVNDVICTGAEPLFFLDYIATGRIDPEVLVGVMRGVVRGCVDAHCALVGGETAEMPLVYKPGEFDLAGFCVGVVEKSKMITGRKIRPGDRLIGLASSGFHSNGYALIQKVLSPAQQQRWGDELLKPTRIYAAPILALLRKINVHGIAHITGGSFREKLGRILPKDTAAFIKTSSWPVAPIFRRVQEAGDLSDVEMYKTFNMGIGMILVVPESQVNAVLKILRRQELPAWVIGEIKRGKPGLPPGRQEVLLQ